MSDHEETLERLRAGVEERPGDPGSYEALAAALAASGKPDEAMAALAAWEGAATAETARARAEAAARLLPLLGTAAGCAGAARILGQGVPSGAAGAPGHTARALARLIELAHARRAGGEQALPCGWTARWEDPRDGLSRTAAVFRGLAGWLHFTALVLPAGLYALMALLAAAGGGRWEPMETDAALAVLPAAILAVAGKLLALAGTPGGMSWGVRQASAMVAAGAVLGTAGWFSALCGSPGWLAACYGALIGASFVNFQFWRRFRRRLKSEDRWFMRNDRAGFAATVVARQDGTAWLILEP